MPKVHGADKAIDPRHRPEAQVRRGGKAKSTPAEPKSMLKPQMTVHPLQPRQGQGTVGIRRKIIQT